MDFLTFKKNVKENIYIYIYGLFARKADVQPYCYTQIKTTEKEGKKKIDMKVQGSSQCSDVM